MFDFKLAILRKEFRFGNIVEPLTIKVFGMIEVGYKWNLSINHYTNFFQDIKAHSLLQYTQKSTQND